MDKYLTEGSLKKDRCSLYLDLVKRIALESYCVRLQVGALIEKDGNIISFGFNGRTSKAPNVCELPLPNEIWKDCSIEGYQVSSLGRIKRLSKSFTKTFQNKSKTQTQKVDLLEHILTPGNNKKGYKNVVLFKKSYRLHRLIAETFIPNPEPEYYNQINHIDGNKDNNNVLNLEWCTNRYNCEDRSAKKYKNKILPMNIQYESCASRSKNPYRAQVYYKGSLQTGRFATIEDATEFVNKFKNEKEYKTFRYNPANDMVTSDEVLHAESNAITKACKSPISTEGATLYCTHSCCIHCAKIIVQSGITRFIYINDYRDSKGTKFLQDCGVEVIKAETLIN
jgi:deoxycytidylate deaminase